MQGTRSLSPTFLFINTFVENKLLKKWIGIAGRDTVKSIPDATASWLILAVKPLLAKPLIAEV